jgi:hypothetical protein
MDVDRVRAVLGFQSFGWPKIAAFDDEHRARQFRRIHFEQLHFSIGNPPIGTRLPCSGTP